LELDVALAPVSSSAGANPPSSPPPVPPPAAVASTVAVTSEVAVGSLDVKRTIHVPGDPKSMALA
jgi:hypothetical protein